MSNDPPGRDSLGTTFKRILRRLILPSNAGPLDDAIILDSNIPGCLSQRYKSVILFRQNNPLFRMQFFIGVVRSDIGVLPTNTSTWIEQGYTLIDDSIPTCWIYVTTRWTSEAGPGAVGMTQSIGNLVIIGGPPVDVPFFFPVSGDMALTGAFTWGQNVSTTRQSISLPGYNSNSVPYTTVGQPAFCGVSFAVPPSGRVLIHLSGLMSNNTLGTGTFLSFIIANGLVVGAGAIVYGPNDSDAISSSNTAGNADRKGATFMFDTGVVGNNYNVYAVHRVTAGNGAFQNRTIIAQPVF